MINKSNLWFITLSSIILVLSIFYISGGYPEEKMVFSSTTNEDDVIVIEESEVLTAMRVTKEEEHLNEMQVLQEVLLNTESTIEDKNKAYEQIKILNNTKTLEEKLQSIIDKECDVSSFVDIKDNTIKVVIANKKESYELANKVINLVHKNLSEKYCVTVKFE